MSRFMLNMFKTDSDCANKKNRKKTNIIGTGGYRVDDVGSASIQSCVATG